MSALVALDKGAALDFRTLGEMFDLTDGNLGAHLVALEKAGYIAVEKSFIERKPRTHARATAKGRRAFDEHVEALEEIVRGPRSGG